jgi:RHS repeat-associated protein
MNHVVGTTDALGQSASYTYDENGNRTSATDVRNNTTTWVYNDDDQLTSVIDPMGNTTKFAYDEYGQLNYTLTPEGQQAHVVYDYANFGRPKNASYRSSDGTLESTVTYTYNDKDQLEKIVDTKAGTQSFTYDAYDRLESTTGPTGTVEYGHDILDRLTTMKAAGVTTTYGYDKSSILTSVKTGDDVVSFELDKVGRERVATMPGGITRTTGYDPDSGAVTSLSYAKGTTSIGDLIYTRDARGQQTRLTGSLASVALPAAESGSVFGKDNRITTFGGRDFQYNKNGELVNDGLRSYGWNARGELTSLIEAGKTSAFGYGPDGDRLRQSTGGAERRFLTNGSNPLVEQDEAGATTATVATSGVDEYLTRSANGQTQVYLTDALGSVIGLANADGTIATRYTYDPNGQATKTGAETTNPYTFTGRQDDGTGLMYYRNRYYDPETGRFISQDPIGAAGGPNLYQYALSSPTTYTDPSGNIPVAVAGCIAGAATEGITEWGAQRLSGRKVNWGDVGTSALKGCAMGALGGIFAKATGKLLSKALNKAKCLVNSFAEGTLVLMADGTYKPIEDIKVGDKVLATDPETGERGARPVTALINGSGEKDLVDITVESATGKPGTFTATTGHPLWLPEEGVWADAGTLKTGQWVQTQAGGKVKITKVRHHTAAASVYNLTVDDLHTYYVLAGQTPVLVHNSNGCIHASVAYQDWATKGAHMHIGKHEVRIFPNGQGGIGAEAIRLRSGTAGPKDVQKVLDEIRSNPSLRSDIIQKAKSARDSMNAGEFGMHSNRAAEIHFLIKALEKMG